jgi:hypothetical protein
MTKRSAADVSEEMFLLFKTFHHFNVKYIIVGGFAVNRYGYMRTTGDIDIFLEDTKINRANLIKALSAMDYGDFDMLMDVPIIAGYCEIMMDEGIYADLMTAVPGLEEEPFDYYYNMATIDEIEDYKIHYLHYNHLLENKLATGREKDLHDVQELKRINNDKGKG